MDNDLPTERNVIFLLLPHLNLLDFAGPAQVFQAANLFGCTYHLHFCATKREIRSRIGVLLGDLAEPPTDIKPSDIVMVPGLDLSDRRLDDKGLSEDLRVWLRHAYDSGARVSSVCTGAFALGDAGLLDGRRCTTHWVGVPALQQRYPAAKVLDGVLFVHDGRITTSAGIASGIDMALALVEQDWGPIVAANVARQMVIYLRRNGSHSQTSIYLQYRTHLHPAIHRAQDYLIHHLNQPVLLEDLAAHVGMSSRQLSRAFKEETDLTPLQYQQRLRLEMGRELLTNADMTIEEIALKCGFEDPRHFRRLWQRHFGASPAVMRRTMLPRRKELPT